MENAFIGIVRVERPPPYNRDNSKCPRGPSVRPLFRTNFRTGRQKNRQTWTWVHNLSFRDRQLHPQPSCPSRPSPTGPSLQRVGNDTHCVILWWSRRKDWILSLPRPLTLPVLPWCLDGKTPTKIFYQHQWGPKRYISTKQHRWVKKRQKVVLHVHLL